MQVEKKVRKNKNKTKQKLFPMTEQNAHKEKAHYTLYGYYISAQEFFPELISKQPHLDHEPETSLSTSTYLHFAYFFLK